ncbi:MAG: hypothetical protein GKR94_27595 [Gammaproteobacteria bacterium]|nr:hypothetical protein [Gammaproteobacteria bacterium]
MGRMDRSGTWCDAGTAPLTQRDCDSVNGRQIERGVHRLQVRMAKAIDAKTIDVGRRGRAHALRRILTRSLSAACVAVKRVSTHKGKCSAGVAGVVWRTSKERQDAVLSIQRGR